MYKLLNDIAFTEQLQKQGLPEAITIPWTGPVAFPDKMVQDFLQDYNIMAPGLGYEETHEIARMLSDCLDDEGCFLWRGFRFSGAIEGVIAEIAQIIDDSIKKCGGNSQGDRITFDYGTLRHDGDN